MSWGLTVKRVEVSMEDPGSWKSRQKSGRSAKVSPLPDKFCVSSAGRERVRLGQLYLGRFLPEPQKTSFLHESFCFLKGLRLIREEPLFLQRIFRSATGFWYPTPPSSPPFFLCGARFPGQKQQMVLFTLEIRLCFSQSHRCSLTASGTV